MKLHTREQEMYPLVAMFLEQRGYNVLIRARPIIASRVEVDVIGFNANKNEIISVEVKLKHLNKALAQAHFRLLFSDYVYIAFPEKYALNILKKKRDLLEKTGIGLLAIDGHVKEFFKARKSSKILPWLKEEVLSTIEPHINKK